MYLQPPDRRRDGQYVEKYQQKKYRAPTCPHHVCLDIRYIHDVAVG